MQPPPDGFDPLQLLEGQNIPAPNADRKSDTLLKANLAYREKISAKAQEGSWLMRLFGRNTPAKERHMNRYTFAKGTAIAVVALVAISATLDYAGDSKRQYPAKAPQQLQSAGAITTEGASTRQEPPLADATSTISGSATQVSEVDSNLMVKPAFEAQHEKKEEILAGRSMPQTAPAKAPFIAADQSATLLADSAIGAAPAGEREQVRIQNNMGSAHVSRALPPYMHEMIAPLPASGDAFANTADNSMQMVALAPVSTFSADTDTASYSTARRMLSAGQMPPKEAVRTEEFVNYFNYNYEVPADKAKPFTPTVAVYPTPWNSQTKLMHIGIKAYDLPATERPPVNLVLLIDVSGSMNSPDRLGLAKTSFNMMLDKLQSGDSVAIVTYAGRSGVALEPTSVEHKDKIINVINNLRPAGSTAGAEGLMTAYELAKRNFRQNGVNRILLATDGDFNVGVSSPGGVAEYVASQRSTGVFLSVLGFGMGNYQDTTMQAIAQNGNGVAAYIDSIAEARRVLDEQLTSTMFTIAKDVKLQVEFNPAAVTSYRLLGYETRALKREDFDNDKVDAGEVGAGHEVTAIYEITPVGSAITATPSLRYGNVPAAETAAQIVKAEPANELAFLRIRYKLPQSDTSTLIERPVTQADVVPALGNASADIKFAAAVAGFSRLLRGSEGMGNFGYQDVVHLASQGLLSTNLPEGRAHNMNTERTNFIELVKNAQAILGNQPKSREDGGVAFPPPQ